MSTGENFVELRGLLKYPNFSHTPRGFARFQGKVAIPFEYTDRSTGEVKQGFNYIKISAWRENAEGLSTVSEDTWIRVQGVIQEKSYDSSCKSCGAPEKKYWSDVLVDNFEVISEAVSMNAGV